jgi:hypothetical protein
MRMVERSSSETISSTQSRRFSIAQRLRIPWAKSTAERTPLVM